MGMSSWWWRSYIMKNTIAEERQPLSVQFRITETDTFMSSEAVPSFLGALTKAVGLMWADPGAGSC